MTDEKSQAQIIRDHINFQFEQNYNYSTKENRALDVKEIMKKYRKLVSTNYTKVKQHHAKLLKEVMILRKIPPQTMGLSKKIPTFTPPHSLDAKITPKPQSVGSIPAPQTGAPFQYQQTVTTPQGTVPVQGAYQVQPPFIKFSEKSVAATFAALYLPLKTAFPEAENLTDEEKLSLGEMWTPIFNKYLSEKMEIVMCFIATAGIFGMKIATARIKSKAKKPKEKLETKEEKSETKTEAPAEENSKPTTQEEIDAEESGKISKLDGKSQWES